MTRDDLAAILDAPLKTPFLPTTVVLVGAGSLGVKMAKAMDEYGIEVVAFADSNEAVHGKQICGLPVMSWQEAVEDYSGTDGIWFVVSIWHWQYSFRQAKSDLLHLGPCDIISFLPYLTSFGFGLAPHYCLDVPEKIVAARDKVLSAFDLCSDEASRKLYATFIRTRLAQTFEGLPEPTERYPADLFTMGPEDVYFDCGAYTGDTVADYIERHPQFGRIFAFEPDPENYAKLRAYCDGVDKSRVRAIPVALAKHWGMMPFAAKGDMSSSVDLHSGEAVENSTWTYCKGEALDYFGDLTPIADGAKCLVKMDIEGAELDALAGAKAMIRHGWTIFSITTEHKQSDLWEVPLFIASVSDKYRFYLRQHLADGQDLCWYAVPEGLAK